MDGTNQRKRTERRESIFVVNRRFRLAKKFVESKSGSQGPIEFLKFYQPLKSMPKKSIETQRADLAAANREEDIVHLITYTPALIIGPFFWSLKCLITIFFATLILNVNEVFCTAPLDTFITLQLTSAYIFLLMWGWIIIGPVPCKSTKPIFIFYGIYIFAQFVFGILGTIWYTSGRTECSESVPELTKLTLFEVVTFWLSCKCVVLHPLVLASFASFSQRNDNCYKSFCFGLTCLFAR